MKNGSGPPRMSSPFGNIEVRGARENNLRNDSLDIPRRQITVFTGVSGSSKSSLVFDTIAAEAIVVPPGQGDPGPDAATLVRYVGEDLVVTEEPDSITISIPASPGPDVIYLLRS
jgi:hypothetical protein